MLPDEQSRVTPQASVEQAVSEFLGYRMQAKPNQKWQADMLQQAEATGFRRAQQVLKELLPEVSDVA